MRMLFDMDMKDYNPQGKSFTRPSVRAIIIRGCKLAMVYSQKYDYYKFPGGGIEACESKLEALVRETNEESGLVIDETSIKEYGYVPRRQKSNQPKLYEIFVQDNYYYLCDVKDEIVSQKLDAYEKAEGFDLRWVYPSDAIYVNLHHYHGHKDRKMLEREAHVLQLLIQEGYFK